MVISILKPITTQNLQRINNITTFHSVGSKMNPWKLGHNS